MCRDFCEAVSTDDGGEGNHGVGAEVEEEAGQHGAGVGACERKDDTDQDEQTDDAPRPAKWRTVHQTEEASGEQNAGNDAEGCCEERIEIAAGDWCRKETEVC